MADAKAVVKEEENPLKEGDIYVVKEDAPQDIKDKFKYIKIGKDFQCDDAEFKSIGNLKIVFTKESETKWTETTKILFEQQIKKHYELFLSARNDRDSRLDDIE